MAFLMDLPPAARGELAARWGVEETTAALYRAMTDPGRVDEQLGRVGGQSQRVLGLLARQPAGVDELLAALPTSRERLSADLDALGGLGLVLRLPAGPTAPRLARAPFGDEQLYVPRDVSVG